MKKLNKKTKILINAFIDNELDVKHHYSIKKLIGTEIEAKNFYDEMISLKKSISGSAEIKASDNFEAQLKNRIYALKNKKEAFSWLYKMFSWFSYQHLTYASASLVFLFFFAFGVYHVVSPKKSIVSKKADFALSSPIPSSEAESAPAATSSPVARAKAKSVPAPSSADVRNGETANERETRELFDVFERRNGRNSSVAVQNKINKGVEEFYNRNWDKSRIHFRSVMQSANRNSVQYKIARDYLSRMPQH